MSEGWRRKKYYQSRVLVETDAVLSSVRPGVLVCLDGAELEILRNLLAYARYRSTWVSEYYDNFYLAPDNEQWDSLESVIAELEYKLMAGCEDITTAIEQLTAQVACLCQNSTNPPLAQPGPAYDQVVEELLTDGTLDVEDTHGGTTPLDAERCALAQLTYAFMFEFMDETVIPTEKVLVDIILPLAVGAVGAAIGGPLLGVPVAAITATLIALGDLAADNELANLVNSLIANKEELVCAMYEGLATSYRQAHLEAADVVNSMESLGATDKIIVRALLSPWAMNACKSVYDLSTAWATSNVTADYCDTCGLVIGDGWFAVRHDLPIEVSHPGDGGYWARVSACGPFYGTYTVIGFVLETIAETGNCNYVTDSDATDCPGTTISVNSSSSLVTVKGYYFCRDVASLDEDAIIAELHPGAEKLVNQIAYPVTGPGDWRVSVRGGYGCDGSGSFVVRYVVYQGTP